MRFLPVTDVSEFSGRNSFGVFPGGDLSDRDGDGRVKEGERGRGRGGEAGAARDGCD